MSSPNQLSFLPDDYLERKAQQRTNAICASLFAVVILATGAAFKMTEQATRKVEAAYNDINRRYAEAAEPIERFRRMQEQQRKMEAHAALSASLLEKVPRSDVLAEVTKALPANVSLLDFLLDARPRAVAPQPGAMKTIYEQKKAEIEFAKLPPSAKVFDITFKITGVADSDVQVAAFMNQLAKSKLFRDVNLVVSDEFQASAKDAKQRKFVIDMMMTPDAEVKRPESAKASKLAHAE